MATDQTPTTTHARLDEQVASINAALDAKVFALDQRTQGGYRLIRTIGKNCRITPWVTAVGMEVYLQAMLDYIEAEHCLHNHQN